MKGKTRVQAAVSLYQKFSFRKSKISHSPVYVDVIPRVNMTQIFYILLNFAKIQNSLNPILFQIYPLF